jgi:2-amino-4-hydroxy-6-hydroxymethyldihydropteridine diphosphokinase
VADSFKHLPHRVAIALGSNLGDSQPIIRGALQALRESPNIYLEAYSHWYQTPAMGPPQPDYLNACAVLRTDLTPRELLHRLLEIEAIFGRERRERWGPRTLDLDLLLFNNVVVTEPGLTIPHPGMIERAFVLIPLCDIVPDWVHPTTGQTITQLTHQVDGSGISALPSVPPWSDDTFSVVHS